MTNFNDLALMGALAIPSVCVWFHVDGFVLKRIDAIATGMVRVVPVSLQHRRLMHYYSWGMLVVAGLIYCVLCRGRVLGLARTVRRLVLPPFIHTAPN